MHSRVIDTQRRTVFSSEHVAFRDAVRKFLAQEFEPNLEQWEAEGIIDRSFWRACGDAGLLCPSVPPAYGGLGLDYSFNAVVTEEIGYYGLIAGTTLQSDIFVDYIVRYGTEGQKHAYLPKLVAGEWVGAIAMTEPDAGSDLQGIRTIARREGSTFVLNGAKTYITNGQNADLVIVVAKTDPDRRSKGISLLLVEANFAGFVRGRNLEKIGQWSSDTSELFFDNVVVPAANLLGEENAGFGYLMNNLAQERLSIAIAAQAGAQRAWDEAVSYTKERRAFGGPIIQLQNTKFVLARFATDLQVGWAHLDWAIARHVQGQLSAAEASGSKYWHTELQWRVVDAAMQLHGAAGYMSEYTISRLWRDARVQRIYGGTSEIMLEVVGRSI